MPDGANGFNILSPDVSVVLAPRFDIIKYLNNLYIFFDFYLFLKFIIDGIKLPVKMIFHRLHQIL